MASAVDASLEVWLTALAGLVHDIGKFAVRADVGKREMTTPESLAEVKYEHALYSDSFVQEVVPPAWRGKITAPRRHHKPESDQDYQVRLADWLSSGEREEDEDSKVPYLLSIFARLGEHNARAYVPLARLNPATSSIFPTLGEPGDWRTRYRDQYKELWDAFMTECKRLPADTLPAYLESLFGLLQEFTWCVPSAYYHNVPDVSLFDHARTTAALAACLAADRRDRAWCERVTERLRTNQADDAICLLVGGDVSGVQTFIYTLTSGGAAKSLRARSFYLQLLTEVVAHYALEALGLPITNLLYAGGGDFQILAPVTASERLRDIRREAAGRLLKIHGGALGLTLDWTPVRAQEFSGAAFGQVWARLGAAIRKGKRQPFAALDAADLFEAVGAPRGTGGAPLRFCKVTGVDDSTIIPDRDDRDLPADQRGYKSEFVVSLEDLGKALPKATHLLAMRVPPEEAAEARRWDAALRAFGAQVAVVAPGYEVGVAEDATLMRVWRLHPDAPPLPAHLPEEARRLPSVTAYRPASRLAAYHWDEHEGARIATFDDLAEHSARGIERWGVLRLDVDNLGELFRTGFGDRNTLSRSAALSSALRWFFEGYAPALGQEWNALTNAVEREGQSWPQAWDAGKRDKLYVQYAGGDDVFVVGAWDALPEYAARIREKLSEYTAGNPHVTVSAGIALADAHYPLYQAARQAGDAEEAAKSFVRPDDRRKDAIHFLGQTVGWEDFGAVRERVDELAAWCQARRIPKSLIQTLLEIGAEYERSSQKGKPRFGRWMWVLAYHLTRAAARAKDAEVKKGIIGIQEDLLRPDGAIRTIGLAARWAELLVR